MSKTTVSHADHADGLVTEKLPASIRILRRMNPLILALLRSPLHGLLSRNLLVLTYVGQRTGSRRSLPLSYVALGDDLILCTRNWFWWRSLRDGRPVEMDLRGQHTTVTPRILDPGSTEALEGFTAFLTKNPGTGETLYGVARGSDGRPRREDLEREVLRSVVVRLERGGRRDLGT